MYQLTVHYLLCFVWLICFEYLVCVLWMHFECVTPLICWSKPFFKFKCYTLSPVKQVFSYLKNLTLT